MTDQEHDLTCRALELASHCPLFTADEREILRAMYDRQTEATAA